MESKGSNPLKRLWQALLGAFKSPAPTAAPTSSPAKPQERTAPKTEHHNVAGTSFRREALLSFGVKNVDYTKTKRELIEDGLIGERIYQTDFYATRVELVPEPDNPQDPKAIKVVVDGKHIGYIKKGSCAHVRKLIDEGSIQSMRCEIKGGRYKVLLEEEDEDGKSHYDLITDEHPLCADLFITLK